MLDAAKRFLRRVSTPRHAVVLTYHSVLESPPPFSIWQYLTKQEIEAQFAALAKYCNCISMSALLSGVRNGRIPSNAVVVTFDDGFANNLHVVLPLLERYQIPATFFITSGVMNTEKLLWPETVAAILSTTTASTMEFAGAVHPLASASDKAASYKALARHMKITPPEGLEAQLQALADAAQVSYARLNQSALAQQCRMMTWSELKQLAQSSLVEIGAHTVNHHRFSSLTDGQVLQELSVSKKALKDHVGDVNYFAYPYGGDEDYCRHHRELVVSAGFTAAFTSSPTCVTAKADVFSIPRMGVGSGGSMQEFIYSVTGGLAKGC